MEKHVGQMIEGQVGDCLWFLEHPPTYTLGTGAQASDVVGHEDIPILKTTRGGRSTYHGPGQRVVYIMLDLNKRKKDIRRFVWALEEWLIITLKDLGIESSRREGRVGIWVETSAGDQKIAAVGLRVRKWCTFHGISLNVNPDLSHYDGIVPCGLKEYGVTSLKALGVNIPYQDLDQLLKDNVERVLLPCLS